MPAETRAVLLASAALFAAAACGGVDIVESVAVATVIGIVSDTGDVTVPDAVVRGSPCATSTFDTWTTTTDADGRYRLEMTLFPSGNVALCVGLIADPPPGTGLRSDTVQVDTVWFSGTPRNLADSIRVDFVLGPGG